MAARVFLDPLHISRQDRIVEGEERWQTIAMIDGVLLVLVAYSVIDQQEEVVRIISRHLKVLRAWDIQVGRLLGSGS